MTNACSPPDRLLWLLVALLAVPLLLLPNLPLPPSLPMTATQRLVAAGAMVLFIVLPWATDRTFRLEQRALWRGLPRLGRWGVGVFLGLGFVSAFASRQPREGVLGAGFFLLLFLVGWGVATATQLWRQRWLRWLGGMCGVAALLYGVRYLYGYAHTRAVGGVWVDGWELFFNFVNVRNFNEYQNATLFLVTYWWWTARRWRGLAAGVLLLWWLLFFFAGSRGALLGVVVAGVVVAGCFRREGWPWIRGTLRWMALAFLLHGVLTHPGFFHQERIRENDFVSRMQGEAVAEPIRLVLWREAVAMGREHPWLGVGPRQYARELQERVGMTTHPHNIVLQILAEWGLLACGLFVGLGGWGTWGWLRGLRPSPETLSATSSLILVGISSQVDTVLISVLGQIGFATTMGIAWGLSTVKAE